MSDSNTEDKISSSTNPKAKVRPTRFSVLWVIPIIAIIVSASLAWRHFVTQGPVITISFDTADGIVPGQTQVKNKAVTLGVVQGVSLSSDMSHADVTVQMKGESSRYLSPKTRFWVVRPRINGTSITGLETVISGAYIALDPGPNRGPFESHFKGLETPPGLRSDQPGSSFWLVSPTLESLGSGAPVFFRDLPVGEVLGYTMPPGGVGPILLQVFVRKPYDKYLKTDSRFWNVSGLQVGVGAGGLKIHLQSIQTLFSGGVAFGRPIGHFDSAATSAEPNSVFRLYGSKVEAENSRYHQKLRLAMYVDTSVGNLTEGSKVTMFGLQVGIVTGVHLQLEDSHHGPRVRVDMEVEPERVVSVETGKENYSRKVLSDFVKRGMRASIQNVSFLTGEAMVTLSFSRNNKPGQWVEEDGVIILPSDPGGMDGIIQSVSSIADKLSNMPLTQMGENINNLLAHTDKRVRSPEVTRSMVALRGSLQALNNLLDQADEDLPALNDNVQKTLTQAQGLLKNYGGDEDFHRNLKTLVARLSQMSRSLRLTADYIDHHPSSLITGRKK
ncbi:MCE family protein [Aristophania vespae]|uniref:MCE family protein n=1 Tax=Aristophania vespae TaxID=2697033 RepID=A0A6P1NC71_9PROT|nr:MlaD family protein [Aristophania vespae]QHI95049.1 MCE family protein [Aristophania vespae]UMM64233.1 Intermembrane transport protein PqiB [Aristophania vespae]